MTTTVQIAGTAPAVVEPTAPAASLHKQIEALVEGLDMATLVHGKYQIMPPLTKEEFIELAIDIAENGVKVPVEFDEENNVLDGHHRFAAFKMLANAGIDVEMFDKIIRKLETEEEKWAHIIALNLKRRHITQEQRQSLIMQLRLPPFSYPMPKIASLVGYSVATVWRDLDDAPEEMRAELDAVRTTIGRDGIERASSYGPRLFYTGNTQLAHIAAQAAGVEQQAAVDAGIEPEARTTQYAVVITCATEEAQAAILEFALANNWDAKALVL